MIQNKNMMVQTLFFNVNVLMTKIWRWLKKVPFDDSVVEYSFMKDIVLFTFFYHFGRFVYLLLFKNLGKLFIIFLVFYFDLVNNFLVFWWIRNESYHDDCSLVDNSDVDIFWICNWMPRYSRTLFLCT